MLKKFILLLSQLLQVNMTLLPQKDFFLKLSNNADFQHN